MNKKEIIDMCLRSQLYKDAGYYVNAVDDYKELPKEQLKILRKRAQSKINQHYKFWRIINQ